MKTEALGLYAHAEGENTIASSNNTHTEGMETTASNICAHAEGASTTASGTSSHAEGQFTTASGSYSHAQNYSTIAAGQSQTTIGEYNISDITSAFIIGNGSADNARSNAYSINWNGESVQAGSATVNGAITAAGAITTSIGNISTASGAINATNDITTSNGGISAKNNITTSAGNISTTNGSITAGGNNGTINANKTITAGTGITATTGNIAALQGNISASGTINAGGSISTTSGNISTSDGNISATGNITTSNGNIEGKILKADTHIQAPKIELNTNGTGLGHGGYIDFHYYNTNNILTKDGISAGTNGQDYTSRIIEKEIADTKNASIKYNAIMIEDYLTFNKGLIMSPLSYGTDDPETHFTNAGVSPIQGQLYIQIF